MAMLHPKFNHLGRSKKKPSKANAEAKAAHDKWLEKRGIKPISKRHRLKGTPYKVPVAPEPDPTSSWPMKR